MRSALRQWRSAALALLFATAPSVELLAAPQSAIPIPPGATAHISGTRAVLMSNGNVTGTYDCSCRGYGSGPCQLVNTGPIAVCQAVPVGPTTCGDCEVTTITTPDPDPGIARTSSGAVTSPANGHLVK